MNLDNTIGSVIRYHRRKGALSQAELAKMAGVGKTVVFDIEKGKLTVQLDTLLKVMHALNIKAVVSSPLMEAYRKSREDQLENS